MKKSLKNIGCGIILLFTPRLGKDTGSMQFCLLK